MRIGDSYYQKLQAEFQKDLGQIKGDFKQLEAYSNISDLLKNQSLIKSLVSDFNQINSLMFEIQNSSNPADQLVAQSANFQAIFGYFNSDFDRMKNIFSLADLLSKHPDDDIAQKAFANALINRTSTGDWDHFLGMAQTYVNNPLASDPSSGNSFSYRLWESLRGFLDLDDPKDADFNLLNECKNLSDLLNNPALFNRIVTDVDIMYNYYNLIKNSKNPEDQKIFQDPDFQAMEKFLLKPIPGSSLSMGELADNILRNPSAGDKQALAEALMTQVKSGGWRQFEDWIQTFINQNPFKSQ
jgi:hypothetical protein